MTGARRRLSVREAEARDIPAIRDIYAHHVLTGTASFEQEPPELAEMERRWRSIKDGGLPYIVAEIDKQICGFGYVAPFRPRPAYRYTLEDSVYVGPNCARMGVGSALLGTLVERCSQANFHRMVAVVGDTSNSASIALHEKHGFRVDGRLPEVGRKFGRWLDIVLLSRSLEDEDGS